MTSGLFRALEHKEEKTLFVLHREASEITIGFSNFDAPLHYLLYLHKNDAEISFKFLKTCPF